MDYKNKNWASSKYLRMMFHTLHEMANFVQTTKYEVTILPRPVGRVQFGVFETFTSAYLFQIAREKSCDHLFIIHMKKCEMVKQKKRTRITQSGKNCAIQGNWTELTLFCIVYKKNCTALGQSESSNFFMHIINHKNKH